MKANKVIEQAILSSPIPKDKNLANSISFLQILLVKYKSLHSLITTTDQIDDILVVLKDLEEVETITDNSENLTFIRYVVGTKEIELGLKYNNDKYLIQGINKLDQIDEQLLPTDSFKSDYYRLFSRALLIRFQNEIKKDKEYKYSFDNIQPLLKAKYFLFRIYSLMIEKRIKLSDVLEARVTTDLVACLVFLSRWSEPFYILDKRIAVSNYSPKHVSFLKGHTLNEMAWYTCCSIYPAMMFEIKKFIENSKGLSESYENVDDNLQRINSESDEIIKNYNFDLEAFAQTYDDTKEHIDEHTNYRQWILRNHFSLCEHAMYCFCALSKTDNLSIKSNHRHTEIEWVYQFEILLDKLKSEYNLARYFLFISEDSSRVQYSREEEIILNSGVEEIISNSTSDFLLQSFRSAYSILDKIGRAIYLALEINQRDVYFHNCWKKIKELKIGHQNRYLYTLYSIACDLSDTSKFSAFKEYKKWRNSMEHEYLFLVANGYKKESVLKKLPMVSEVIIIDEFKEKTFYMLQLCRAAIFSFAFFIRHESKQKEKIIEGSCFSNREENKLDGRK